MEPQLTNRTQCIRNLPLCNEKCDRNEALVIHELATSPTFPGTDVRRFILSTESVATAASPTCDSKQLPSRSKVLTEIVESERTYVSNLQTILTSWKPVLECLMVPEDLQSLIPYQLDSLFSRHCRLLTDIELQSRSDTNMLGEVFCNLCNRTSSDLMGLYSSYYRAFSDAMDTLVKYEQHDTFQQALEFCQHQPECHGLGLAAFLLTPIQRIPRYELLLKELLKYTPKDHPDWGSLQLALQRLKEEMILLNHSIQPCQLKGLIGMESSRLSQKKKRPQKLRGQLWRHSSQGNINIVNYFQSDPFCLSEQNLHRYSRESQDELEVDVGSVISFSDLTLDLEIPSTKNTATGPMDLSLSLQSASKQQYSSPVQSKLSIGSPVHFRHVQHYWKES